MNEYETIFVVRPDAGESQINQLLERVDQLIGRHDGTVIKRTDWGKRELAYEVNKYDQGIYFHYDYSGDSETVADLERTLKLQDLPMKFLTVKLSDNVDVKARQKELMKEDKGAVKVPAETPPVQEKSTEVSDA